MDPRKWRLPSGAPVFYTDQADWPTAVSSSTADATLFGHKAWFRIDSGNNTVVLFLTGTNREPVHLSPIPDTLEGFVAWAWMVIEIGDRI